MKTVGEIIGDELCRQHLRQKDLARKLMVSESTVQKWVSGKNCVPADRIRDLSVALSVSPLLLLGYDPDNDVRVHKIPNKGRRLPTMVNDYEYAEWLVLKSKQNERNGDSNEV